MKQWGQKLLYGCGMIAMIIAVFNLVALLIYVMGHGSESAFIFSLAMMSAWIIIMGWFLIPLSAALSLISCTRHTRLAGLSQLINLISIIVIIFILHNEHVL